MYWLLICLIGINGYKFNKITCFDRGATYYLYISDLNHNGLSEIIWENGDIYEYRPLNQYEFVYNSYRQLSDTSSAGGIIPGDCDRDGLSLLAGGFRIHREREEKPNIWGGVVLKSKEFHSFPYDIVWSDTFVIPMRLTDLDSDGKGEVFSVWYWQDEYGHWGINGIKIYENQGDNNFIPVFKDSVYIPGPYVFGDFDGDEKREWFASAIQPFGLPPDTLPIAAIWECVGDNNYKMVWEDHRLGLDVYDAWFGNDTDGDGKPEIFLKTYRPTILQMYEATGDNTYKYVVIDTIPQESSIEAQSSCGDVDGDGREEVVVSLGHKVIIYKAVGDDKYEKVWEWKNTQPDLPELRRAITLCHDFNKNGYDEIVIASKGVTYIFEIDTTYGIASKPKTPKSYNLSISPNPANGMVDIRYEIPDEYPVALKVYDASGRLVKILAKIQNPEPGAYKLKWNGRDDNGKILPPGVYFIKLKAKGITKTEKVILMR